MTTCACLMELELYFVYPMTANHIYLLKISSRPPHSMEFRGTGAKFSNSNRSALLMDSAFTGFQNKYLKFTSVLKFSNKFPGMIFMICML